MASLKETKNRISSVQNTLKITSAMKLIASAKFHQAQVSVKKVQNYEQNLLVLLNELFEGREEMDFVFTNERPVKRVAIIPFSSNTGLCGAFNSNVLKFTEHHIELYKKEGIDVSLYPIGVKIANSLIRASYLIQEDGRNLLEKPSVEKCMVFSNLLMKEFQAGTFDKVVVLYHRMKTATRQVLSDEVLLPYGLPKQESTIEPQDLLTEPSPIPFLKRLFPDVLCTRLYYAVSESLASEHGARMTAMQIATDNANDLLRELTILFNKTRQQSITNEILDLVGGRIRRG